MLQKFQQSMEQRDKEIKKMQKNYDRLTEDLKREKVEEQVLRNTTQISDSMTLNSRNRVESEIRGANDEVRDILR